MTKKITTFFTSSGTPQTGLSATIRIRNGAGTLVVTNVAMTEIGDGFYGYDFTTYDEEEEYSIRCDGSATLTNDIDRYTYAGNESYMEDVLDATASDHDTAGTIGAEIMGSGGVIVGQGNGGGYRAMTKEEMEAIAREVWQVMIGNDKSAKEVLLSRSDFNVIRDRVLLKDAVVIPKPVEYTKEIKALMDSIKSVSDRVDSLAKKPAATLSIPNSIVSDITTIMNSVESVVKPMTSTVKAFTASGEELKGKVDSLESQLAGTNLDLSKAHELASALILLKNSMMALLSMSSMNAAMATVQERQQLKRAMLSLTNLKFNNLQANLRR